jgi:hypothetical protein
MLSSDAGHLDVLEHQLPVGRDELSRVPEYLDLPAIEHAVEEFEHVQTEIVFERFDLVRERGEHDTMPCRDLQLA